jgi:hypothetical protein
MLFWHIHIYNTQAAYNNTSEIELEVADVLPTQTSDLSLYPISTKVAKQFDGADGQLVWFEGLYRGLTRTSSGCCTPMAIQKIWTLMNA